MNFREYMKDRIVIFDGAFGTMLQNEGLELRTIPEVYNMTHREKVTSIHRKYVDAGCDVVTANTFGACELKLKEYCVEDIIKAAVNNARDAGPKYVALDVGPTGRVISPSGETSFESAVEIFKRQMIAGEEAGADLILIETMSDLYEAKAAIIAAKEATSLPVICTMSFQEDGRTFMGTDAITAVTVLQGLGVDALGVNCSLGPKRLMPIIEVMTKYSKIPVVVQANAGLPQERNGNTVYDISAKEYCKELQHMREIGVSIFGGCCGTTPEYIRMICKSFSGKRPVKNVAEVITACASYSKTVILDGRTTVIGERINPTGKKKLAEALKNKNWGYIIDEALRQTKCGSDILDVNCGLPGIDEEYILRSAIREIQAVTDLPLQIDSSDPDVIEAGVRFYNGKPVINSVNGDKDTMRRIFPIAKKYGALVIGLTLDEKGIPENAEKRLDIARKIVECAKEYAIAKEDLIIDCLVLTASAQQEQVRETLKAVRLVKDELGLKTVLGISNVSFGLPSRKILNSTFLAAALGNGLDAAIVNPTLEAITSVIDSFRVLNNEDVDSTNFIKKYSGQNAQPEYQKEELSLIKMIVDGNKNGVELKTRELLKIIDPIDIINEHFVPALDRVGEKFDRGEVFLPQLMQSAESVKVGFEIVKGTMEKSGIQIDKGKIVIATVKGDVHDIGKNIAKMILENYGYSVIDLGKDVEPGTIVEQIKKNKVKLAGLSALMTTTVGSMEETIKMLRKENANCKVMVGGAVLNEEYAKKIGADFYVKDAKAGVRVAEKVLGKQ